MQECGSGESLLSPLYHVDGSHGPPYLPEKYKYGQTTLVVTRVIRFGPLADALWLKRVDYADHAFVDLYLFRVRWEWYGWPEGPLSRGARRKGPKGGD